MKTNLKISSFFILTLLLFTFSCSSDDDNGPQISAPTMSLSTSNFVSPFFTTGQTQVPSVNWNGNTGTFSLGTNIQGVSIDASSGVVSWGKSLPVGSNTIQLVATNSAGQSTINVTVDNQFAGNFTGGYNTDPSSTVIAITGYELNFNTDGTMTVSDGGSPGSGVWTRSGNTITTVYVYDGSTSSITVVSDLVHTETEANITGLWGFGETLPDPADGYIELAIQ